MTIGDTFFLSNHIQNNVKHRAARPGIKLFKLSCKAYIDWNNLPSGAEGIKTALEQQAAGLSLSSEKVTTLQDNLNSLIPGLAALCT